MSSGRGQGKLILVGEHAVVYGQPAIAFAVDKGTTVTLTPGDRVRFPEAVDRRGREALSPLVGEDVTVTIDSTLPTGRGMGSSAALAVAAVRARAALDGEALSDDEVVERAMVAERVFHGNPSGLDVEVSARGGVLRYQKGPPKVFEPLPTPDWTLVVLDTGQVGDTAALVAGVGARRPSIDPVLERMGALVDEVADVLEDPKALGLLLDENQRLLEAIGVSSPEIEALCALAREAGALGAKLSGAGGGGVVIALVDDPAPVLEAAEGRGVSAEVCRPA